jgi:uncharacterized protein (UPF0276 family)
LGEGDAVKFAVNYSAAAADLFREGRIQVDRFKCPAWADVVAAAQELHAVYVHLPLRIGAGIGEAINTETRQPADWQQIEPLLARTDTPQINVHLAPFTSDFPGIPADTSDPAHVEMLTAHALRDLEALVTRFGPARITVENADDGKGLIPHPALRPNLIRQVIEETGCGFLLDVAHARLAAHTLGMDAREYLAGLPTACTTEIHLAGIQRFAGQWMALMRQPGLTDKDLGWFAGLRPGQLLDHLPLVDEDWAFYVWALEQVDLGHWGEPWITTLEYGGVGGVWELLTDRAVLSEQVPRLYHMVKHHRPRIEGASRAGLKRSSSTLATRDEPGGDQRCR